MVITVKQYRGIPLKPEQFTKTDKWLETPLKNVFPAFLLFTEQVSVNYSSFLYNVNHTTKKES